LKAVLLRFAAAVLKHEHVELYMIMMRVWICGVFDSVCYVHHQL